jgi:hypothetical protein
LTSLAGSGGVLTQRLFCWAPVYSRASPVRLSRTGKFGLAHTSFWIELNRRKEGSWYKKLMVLHAGEQRACVCCGKALPWASVTTQPSIPKMEAQQHGWTGREQPDGTVTINMCLQCQIHRSERKKRAESA